MLMHKSFTLFSYASLSKKVIKVVSWLKNKPSLCVYSCPCFFTIAFGCLTQKASRNWRVVFLTRGTELVLYLSVCDRRENTGIHEPESVPLGRSLGLEVPPDPTLGCGLIGADLGLNVAPGIVLEGCRPLGNVLSPAAVANLGVAQIGTIEACAASVAIQVLCTVPGEKSANLSTIIRKMGILTSWHLSTLQLNT